MAVFRQRVTHKKQKAGSSNGFLLFCFLDRGKAQKKAEGSDLAIESPGSKEAQYIRLLLLLNIADFAFTGAGIVTRNIKELNPAMAGLFEQPYLLFLTKLILPTVLFIIFERALEGGRLKLGTIGRFAVAAATYCYTAVIYLHAYWLWKAVLKYGSLIKAFAR